MFLTGLYLYCKNMKKLKIAIMDMDDLKNPFWGAGQAQVTREVGKRLAKKHEVIVYSSKYPGYKDYLEDGIFYKHIGIVSKSSKITNIAYLLSVPLQVRKIKDADIIIEEFNAPISVSFSPLFTKIPLIAIPTIFAAEKFAKKYHIPFNWIESFGVKFYKYFLPYSETDSGKIKRLNPKAISKIVPVGVGEEFFKIRHYKPEYILFLSRFDIHQKGIDLLLESYSKISDKIGYPLVLAGHGSDEQKVKEMIKKLKIERKVRIVGPAYGKKKFDLISKAIFVAFPSRFDELSLWALEALAAGMPLVAFSIPEAKWADKSVALKAKPFNTEEYARLMLKATNKDLNKQMRIAARSLAKKYNWDEVTEDFEDFFEEVLKREGKYEQR